MRDLISRGWWTFLVRGGLAVLFGLFAFLRPGMAVVTLMLLFGFFAIAEGALNLALAFSGANAAQKRRSPSWSLVLHGLLSMGAGAIALFAPGLTAVLLLYLIAAWAVTTGAMEIIVAIRLRRHIEHEWLLGVSGLVSIAFGVLLFAFPRAGALALIFWVAAYAIVFGIMMIALGVEMHHRLRGAQPPRGIPSMAPGP